MKTFNVIKESWRLNEKIDEEIIRFSNEQIRNDYVIMIKNYYIEIDFNIDDIFINGFSVNNGDEKWSYDYHFIDEDLIIYDELPNKILI